MADLDPLGKFPSSKMAQAAKLGQSRFYSREKAPSSVPTPPPGVTGLIGWWDVSVTASLTLSGSNVTSIADQSGLGNTLLGINNPVYSATSFTGGKPGITTTTAANNSLAKTSFTIGTGTDLTAWMVLRRNGGGAYARYLSYTATTGTGHDYNDAGSFSLTRNATADSVSLNHGITWSSTGTELTVGASRRLIFTQTGGIETVYVDGVAAINSNRSTVSWSSPGYLGFFGSLADGNGEGIFAEGGIATNFSNATAVGQLDSYLKSKWGL